MIHNLTLEDSGFYRAVDDDGNGDEHLFEIRVGLLSTGYYFHVLPCIEHILN